jgi:hypothetical protein
VTGRPPPRSLPSPKPAAQTVTMIPPGHPRPGWPQNCKAGPAEPWRPGWPGPWSHRRSHRPAWPPSSPRRAVNGSATRSAGCSCTHPLAAVASAADSSPNFSRWPPSETFPTCGWKPVPNGRPRPLFGGRAASPSPPDLLPICLHRLGGGKSRVAGEDTPPCSASVRRPPSLPGAVNLASRPVPSEGVRAAGVLERAVEASEARDGEAQRTRSERRPGGPE